MANYLGELFRLGGEKRDVPAGEWAEAMGVSIPAASRMAGRMARMGLVERRAYRGARLTSLGRREGLRAVRAHRLAEAFLVRVLGYGWHEAHETADRLGEIADEELVRRMDAAAGHPTRCPHGEPIPDADGGLILPADQPLTNLEVGQRAVVSRVRVRDRDRLIYLAEMGLVPEASLRVAGRAPFNGPVRVEVGRGECVLGFDLAQLIWVERLSS
ncbi:MAG TPA: metal-dependent transcriptional regulator [Anaerolineales bacterium]|nr:metal-dependent transcriptional regulator [Anaerolineales bacterium]